MLTHSPHSLTRSLARSPHSLTHSLTHSPHRVCKRACVRVSACVLVRRARARFSAPQSCWRGLPVAHPNIVDLDLDPVCGPLDECDGWPCARCGLARGAPDAGPVHQLDSEATPSRECLCTCRPTAGQWEARCGGRLQLCLSIHVVTVAIRFEITSALFRHDALVSPQSFEIGAHVAQTRRLRSHSTSSPHMSGRHDTHASPRARKRCGRSRSRWRQTSRRAVRPVVAHPRTGRSLPLAMQLRLRAKVTASTLCESAPAFRVTAE